MGKLIILNYMTADIDIYNIPTDCVDEEYVEDLGYNTNFTEWMSAPKFKINLHNTKLTDFQITTITET